MPERDEKGYRIELTEQLQALEVAIRLFEERGREDERAHYTSLLKLKASLINVRELDLVRHQALVSTMQSFS
jgi:hypothetical protein